MRTRSLSLDAKVRVNRLHRETSMPVIFGQKSFILPLSSLQNDLQILLFLMEFLVLVNRGTLAELLLQHQVLIVDLALTVSQLQKPEASLPFRIPCPSQ